MSRDIAEVLRGGCALAGAALPNAPGPLALLAGGGAGWLCTELLFCEENPLLNDGDVPECEPASAGPALASARQSVNTNADRNDFMMSFHKVVE